MSLLAGLGAVGKGISQGAEDWRKQDEADARKEKLRQEKITFDQQQEDRQREVGLRNALSAPGADVPAAYRAAGKHAEALQYETNQRTGEIGKLDFAEKQRADTVKQNIRNIYNDHTTATAPIDESDPEAVSKRAAAFKNTIEGAGEVLTKLGGTYKGFTYHGINDKGAAVIFSNPDGDTGEVPITPELMKQAMQMRIDAADPDSAIARHAALAQKREEKGIETQSKIDEAVGTGKKAESLATANYRNAAAAGINNESLTLAQQRSNAEIDAARDAIAGLSQEEIAHRTARATNTGRENVDFDPSLARQVALAARRKVGTDDRFDQRTGASNAGAGNQVTLGGAPIGNWTDERLQKSLRMASPTAKAKIDAELTRRTFSADPAMARNSLGELTPKGYKVLDGEGKHIGYYTR